MTTRWILTTGSQTPNAMKVSAIGFIPTVAGFATVMALTMAECPASETGSPVSGGRISGSACHRMVWRNLSNAPGRTVSPAFFCPRATPTMPPRMISGARAFSRRAGHRTSTRKQAILNIGAITKQKELKAIPANRPVHAWPPDRLFLNHAKEKRLDPVPLPVADHAGRATPNRKARNSEDSDCLHTLSGTASRRVVPATGINPHAQISWGCLGHSSIRLRFRRGFARPEILSNRNRSFTTRGHRVRVRDQAQSRHVSSCGEFPWRRPGPLTQLPSSVAGQPIFIIQLFFGGRNAEFAQLHRPDGLAPVSGVACNGHFRWRRDAPSRSRSVEGPAIHQ